MIALSQRISPYVQNVTKTEKQLNVSRQGFPFSLNSVVCVRRSRRGNIDQQHHVEGKGCKHIFVQNIFYEGEKDLEIVLRKV